MTPDTCERIPQIQNLHLCDKEHTALKVSVFGIIFVRIFSHSHFSYLLYISPYSVQIRENTDQNNSDYGHFTQWQLDK